MPNDDSGSRRITSPTHTATQAETVTPTVTTTTHKTVHEAPRQQPAPVHTPPAPAVPVRDQQPDHEVRPARAAKTSAAAVFALVFGLAALFCALTAILSPAAIVFGIIGLILAAVGLKMAKKPGVTGKGVAIGGLVTALLGLILGGVVLGGIASVLNNKTQLDRIQTYLDKQEAKLPSAGEVRNQIPGQ